MWKAARRVLNNISMQGCNFHWKQAVFRKVTDLGLRTAYSLQGRINEFITRLMALPFLPTEHVLPAFARLQQQATSAPLQDLCLYLQDTWMNSSTWSVAEWNCFLQPIRTNNDCEGWHRALNEGKSGAPPFYLAIIKLHEMTEFTALSTRLISSGKMVRRQRKMYRNVQGKIFSLWEKYENRDITTDHLLSAIAHLNL